MRILYIGPLNKGGTCFQRFNALSELNHNVMGINTYIYSKHLAITNRVLNHLKINADILRINKKILVKLKSENFDILWIDKGLIITPNTLLKAKKFLPNLIIVSYSPDDMMNNNNQSNRYLESVSLYDFHITTKSYNVNELKSIGAKEVIFVNNAYDPSIHRPIKLSEEEIKEYSCDVGFIGQFERDRLEKLLFLAKNNIKVEVKGPDWGKYKNVHPNLIIKSGWILEDEYAKCICATKINLCFLRKVNRDLQTTRSIEIPACGGFMLAERTIEHQYLFEEGKEAIFFSSDDELLELTSYYLNNSTLREKVASCGLQKCHRSGYSNQERLKALLNNITSV